MLCSSAQIILEVNLRSFLFRRTVVSSILQEFKINHSWAHLSNLARSNIPLKSFLYWLLPILLFPVLWNLIYSHAAALTTPTKPGLLSHQWPSKCKSHGCFSVFIFFDIHISILDSLLFLSPRQCFFSCLLGKFSNCKVQTNHLKNLVKMHFWFSRSGVESEILVSQWCTCCWSMDHTLSSKVQGHHASSTLLSFAGSSSFPRTSTEVPWI